MRKIFSILLMLLAFAGCTPEETLETLGTISGRVIEAGSNQPMAYARVDISGVGQSITTGEDGLYTFRNLPEGEYTVTASKLGYSTVKKQFVVRAGQTNSGDFALEQSYADVQISTKTLDFGMTLDKMTFDIVKDAGTAQLDWTIERQSNATWVSFSSTEGKLIAPRTTVTVYIDRSQLTQSTLYSTDVIIRSKMGGATSLRITAQKKGATIVAEPTSLDFGSTEVERTLVLKNTDNDDAVAYKVSSTESWCTVVNGEGTLNKDGIATIKVKVARTGLSAATYSGTLVLTSTVANLTIPVTMQVAAKAAPEVTALQTQEVRHSSLNASAFLTSVGSSAVTAYGFCWSQTNTQPTTADSKNALGGTTVSKSFNSTITGLTPNTIYYLRAYAINEEGISYSYPVQVKTLPTPTRPNVKTTNVGRVQHNAAEVNGTITDLGDGFVTSHGFVFSRSNHEPTTADEMLDLGSTTSVAEFEGTLSGLHPESTYYVRAFAKNSVGISYGGVVKLTTKSAPPAVVNGLLAYYTFDNQDCDDALGEIDYNGVVQGKGNEMSFVKDTPDGKGYALKGSVGGKYYKILRAPEQGKSTVTYSAWVKTKATTTIFLGNGRDYGRLAIYNGRVSTSGYTDYNFDIEVDNLLCDGKWHHLVVTIRAYGKCDLYIDGRFYETLSQNWGASLSGYQVDFIGYYDGIMDNLRIYNRPLSHGEIKEIYRAKQ